MAQTSDNQENKNSGAVGFWAKHRENIAVAVIAAVVSPLILGGLSRTFPGGGLISAMGGVTYETFEEALNDVINENNEVIDNITKNLAQNETFGDFIHDREQELISDTDILQKGIDRLDYFVIRSNYELFRSKFIKATCEEARRYYEIFGLMYDVNELAVGQLLDEFAAQSRNAEGRLRFEVLDELTIRQRSIVWLAKLREAPIDIRSCHMDCVRDSASEDCERWKAIVSGPYRATSK